MHGPQRRFIHGWRAPLIEQRAVIPARPEPPTQHGGQSDAGQPTSCQQSGQFGNTRRDGTRQTARAQSRRRFASATHRDGSARRRPLGSPAEHARPAIASGAIIAARAPAAGALESSIAIHVRTALEAGGLAGAKRPPIVEDDTTPTRVLGTGHAVRLTPAGTGVSRPVQAAARVAPRQRPFRLRLIGRQARSPEQHVSMPPT